MSSTIADVAEITNIPIDDPPMLRVYRHRC